MGKKKTRAPLPQLPVGSELIDSHCHLDMKAYNSDLTPIIDRSRQAGVKRTITIGIDLKSSARAIELAAEFPGIFAAVGVHPHHAAEISPASLTELKKLARKPGVVAYGEIGMDTVKNYAPLDIQQMAMTEQVKLARELGLPMIIHDREAHEQVYQILHDLGPFPAGGVIHCFSGDSNLAASFIDLGFYISIPGVVTFNKATELQDAVRDIPLNRMMVETDGPFLAPMPWRGKRNEPAYVTYTAEKIAELKNISLAEVADQTTANCETLFKLPAQ